MRFAVLLLATGGFVGYFPIASGTVGTVVGVPIFLLTASAQHAWPSLALLLLALATLVGCWVAGRAEEILEEHDSHAIVLDEILGYLAATLLLPATWDHALTAFLVFRLFDVVKPFPANVIDQRLPGGYGVVLDDVVAGLYANLATRLIHLFF